MNSDSITKDNFFIDVIGPVIISVSLVNNLVEILVDSTNYNDED